VRPTVIERTLAPFNKSNAKNSVINEERKESTCHFVEFATEEGH